MKNKKLILIIILVLVFFSILLIYYNTYNKNNLIEDSNNDIILEKAKFSKEIEQLLNIIDEKLVFFDYKLNDKIKEIETTIWQCKDNNWTKSTVDRHMVNKTQAKIGIKITNDKIGIVVGFNEDGYVISETEGLDLNFDNLKVVSESSENLYDNKVEPNKDFVLYQKYGFFESKNNSVTFTSDFTKQNCDRGLVVTVKFLDDNINRR